jgi:hypothetical protein
VEGQKDDVGAGRENDRQYSGEFGEGMVREGVGMIKKKINVNKTRNMHNKNVNNCPFGKLCEVRK